MTSSRGRSLIAGLFFFTPLSSGAAATIYRTRPTGLASAFNATPILTGVVLVVMMLFELPGSQSEADASQVTTA